MNDFPAARTAYEERLALAAATGDPILLADAHYDLGFLSMVAQERGGAARPRAARARPVPGGRRRGGAPSAPDRRIVLAYFLGGDYEAAADLEYQNLDVFRRIGSRFQVADSMTLLSAIHWRLGDSDDGLDTRVRSPDVLLRHRGHVRTRPSAGDGRHHPAVGRGRRIRWPGRRRRLPDGPRAGRDARPGRGPPPARSGRAGDRTIRCRPDGRAARRGRRHPAGRDRGADPGACRARPADRDRADAGPDQRWACSARSRGRTSVAIRSKTGSCRSSSGW